MEIDQTSLSKCIWVVKHFEDSKIPFFCQILLVPKRVMKWMAVSITMCQRKHLKASCIVTGKLDVQNLILPSGCLTFKIEPLFLCIVQNS